MTLRYTQGYHEPRRMMSSSQVYEKKPPWLKVKLPTSPGYFQIKSLAGELQLHTVCEDSLCPNIAECWAKKTATFMILGGICTRACRFCAVKSGHPNEYDLDEPKRVATAIHELGVKYAVITSVARDDLADGGACIFAQTIREIRRLSPQTKVEVLVPDFQGKLDLLKTVLDASPDVFGHNIETVERLQKVVRSKSTYERSLSVLAQTRKCCPEVLIKSGLQVGHGEEWHEIIKTIEDLASISANILTIGQYLRPTKRHRAVVKYYTPEEFRILEKDAKSRGITYVFSGPLVRSSYKAEQVVMNC